MAGAGGPPEPAGDPAQQSLGSALRSSFAILRLVIFVLLALYLLSGVFRIQPGEQGIVARFGKLMENRETGKFVFTEGWVWWVLPEPFDEKITISGNIERMTIDTFMFARTEDAIRNDTDIATLKPRGNQINPGRDGAMLTGDKNLSHGLWEVEYRIVDGAAFVTHVGEGPEEFAPLLQRSLENSILREVAYRKVEEVTRTKIDSVADRVLRRLQKNLDALHTGVEVVKTNPNVIVPAQVAPAFTEVTNAENERTRQEHGAEQKATEILNQAAGPAHRAVLEKIRAYGAAQLAGAEPEELARLLAEINTSLDTAEGEVAVALREARAEANTVREEINRQYQEYTEWLKQYRALPQATLVSLWSQMREQILTNKDNELFWLPDSNVIEILVNRDPNRAIEAERERLQKQMQDQER
jgi:membrane protease subunit HflK